MTETTNSMNTETVEQKNEPIAAGDISLKTALRILETIYNNGREAVGFWAAKTAYSGVYRTAVKHGWIEDGLYVTDIPEGVDGGFLAADMQRIALMARLLADVLKDRLEEDMATDSYPDIVDRAVQERVRELLSQTAIEVQIAQAFDEVLEELNDLRDEALEELNNLRDEALGEIKAAKSN